MLTIALMWALTLLAVALGWFGHDYYLRSRPAQLSLMERRCDVCRQRLPKGTIRTSLGHWRCDKHKAA